MPISGPAQTQRKSDKPEPSNNAPTGKPDKETPAAGPHAKDHLTNKDATPGAGSLSDEQAGGGSDPGTG